MRKLILPATISAILLAALFSLNVFAGGEPLPAAPVKVTGYTFYSTAVVSGTTVNTAPSATSLGVDPAKTGNWNSADVFITTDVATSAQLTATVQFSGDGTNYANAYWYGTDSSGVAVANLYRQVLTADGTAYLRVPIAGDKMRVTLLATGQTTTSVYVVYRNN